MTHQQWHRSSDSTAVLFCAPPPLSSTFVQDEWPEDPSAVSHIRSDFSSDPDIGDRRQELVFIGQVGLGRRHSRAGTCNTFKVE